MSIGDILSEIGIPYRVVETPSLITYIMDDDRHMRTSSGLYLVTVHDLRNGLVECGYFDTPFRDGVPDVVETMNIECFKKGLCLRDGDTGL